MRCAGPRAADGGRHPRTARRVWRRRRRRRRRRRAAERAAAGAQLVKQFADNEVREASIKLHVASDVAAKLYTAAVAAETTLTELANRELEVPRRRRRRRRRRHHRHQPRRLSRCSCRSCGRRSAARQRPPPTTTTQVNRPVDERRADDALEQLDRLWRASVATRRPPPPPPALPCAVRACTRTCLTIARASSRSATAARSCTHTHDTSTGAAERRGGRPAPASSARCRRRRTWP